MRKHQHAPAPSLPAQAPTGSASKRYVSDPLDGLRQRRERNPPRPARPAAELVNGFAPEALGHEPVEMGLAIGAIALVGLSIYRKGIAALRQGRLNINAPMSVAVSGAFLIGHRQPELSPRDPGECPGLAEHPGAHPPAVEEAQAARYTPAVFLLACAVAVLVPFLLGVAPLRRRSWFRNVRAAVSRF